MSLTRRAVKRKRIERETNKKNRHAFKQFLIDFLNRNSTLFILSKHLNDYNDSNNDFLFLYENGIANVIE